MTQTNASETRPRLSATPAFHHVAIQTADLDNSAAWYEAFLGFSAAWSLSTFSELTHSRLPGIQRLAELVLGEIRVHLFERQGHPAPPPGESLVQFQHLCFAVAAAADMATLRQRWLDLYESGRFAFAVPDPPTDVVVDGDGVQSFYALDPNGLELEFTHVPAETARDR
ncbi:MAG TPA: VOC family protein [Candidatus Dormibacteraeota bacterium]|nr:VOC family protein [Candidatus Dormibacteraeota bacterium]